MWLYLVLAITQIIVEMAPVSSSGHVALVKDVGEKYGIFPPGWMMPEWLEYILNVPALLVLLLFFRHEIYSITRRFSLIFYRWTKNKALRWSEKYFMQLIFQLFLLTIFADVLTAVLYFSGKYVYATGVAGWQQSIGFLLTGLGLFSLRWVTFQPHQHFTIKNAFILGITQGCAKVFLVSRMGITLVMAQWLGFSFRRSMQLSFFIYAPLLLATILKALYIMPLQDPVCTFFFSIPFLSVILCATVISYFLLAFVVRLGIEKRLWILSFYMIIPFILSLFF